MPTTHTLDLSFGPVRVEQIEASDEKPWITAYELTGNRIRGAVQIVPQYHEPIVGEYRREVPNEHEWEFLPSAFFVAFGDVAYYAAQGNGTLDVNGSRLTGGTTVYTKHETDWRFSVRRKKSGIGDYPAPDGARAKTREVIRALVLLHQEDPALVHEKAAAFARHKQSTRLSDIEKEYREVDVLLRTLNGRSAELQMRRELMSGPAFKKALTEVAPAVA
ncbi:hypothetical protein [Streptomyces variabilis]